MSDVCDDLGISYEEICFLGCCHLLGAIEAVSSTPGYKEAMLSQKIFCKALEQTIAKRVDPTAVISSEKVLIVMAVGGLAVMKYKQFSGSPYIQVQNESESESESETDLTKTSFSNPATGTHSAFS